MKIPSVEEIIEQISKLRYEQGYSTGNLVKFLMNSYKLGEARSYELIRYTREHMGELQHKLNPNVLGDAIEFLGRMQQRAIANGDDKLALDVQKELDKIQQLYIQKIELDDKRDIPMFGIENKEEE